MVGGDPGGGDAAIQKTGVRRPRAPHPAVELNFEPRRKLPHRRWLLVGPARLSRLPASSANLADARLRASRGAVELKFEPRRGYL
jgi:hypothetical protein